MEDCELGNSTGSLLLTCRPGFDGGLSQVFNLEILVTATRSLLRNITRHEPRFQLGQLHASQPVSCATAINHQHRCFFLPNCVMSISVLSR